MTTTTHHIGSLVTAATNGLSGDTKPPPPDDRDTEAHRAADTLKRVREGYIETYNRKCPAEYKKTDWGHPGLTPYRPQIDKVRNWQFGARGIVASGPTRRGKTRAMYDLYRRLACEEGRDVQFYTAMQFFGKLQEQVNYGRDEASGLVEAISDRNDRRPWA
jgi:predicted ATPase